MTEVGLLFVDINRAGNVLLTHNYSTTAHIDFDDVYSVIKRVQLFQIFQVLCFIVVFYFSRSRSGR